MSTVCEPFSFIERSCVWWMQNKSN